MYYLTVQWNSEMQVKFVSHALLNLCMMVMVSLQERFAEWF